MNSESRLMFFRVFILLFFPVLIGAFLLKGLTEFQEQVRQDGVREGLGRELRDLLSAIEPERFFSEYCADLAEEIKKMSSPESVSALIDRETQRHPDLVMEICVFDASGQVCAGNSRFTEAINRLWRRLYGEAKVTDRPLRLEFRQMFGKDFSWESILRFPREARPIWGREGNGFLWYDGLQKGTRKGVLFIAWDTPAPLPLIRRYLQEKPSTADLVFARESDGKTKVLQGQVQEKSPTEIARIFASRQIRDFRLFLCRNPDVAGARGLERFQSLLFLMAFLLVAILAFRLNQRGAAVFFSIRFKLLGLFLYAVFLPVLGLGILAFRNLQDRRQVLTEQVRQQIVDVLSGIDNDFNREREAVLAFFRSLRDDPRMRSDRASMLKDVKAAESSERVNWFEARNLKAEILLTCERPEITKDIGLVARVIAKTLIARFLQDRLPPGSKAVAMNPAEVITQSVIDSPVTGWGNILNMPDRLHEVQMGEYGIFWYWDFIRDPTHPVALVQGNHRIRHSIRLFLNRILKNERFAIHHGALRVLGWEFVIDQYFPAQVAVPEQLALLLRMARLENDIVHERLALPEGEFLAVAMPGKNLHGVLLTALFPMTEIERPLRYFRRNVFWGILLVIVLACLIGWILAETLLAPIGHLLFGVRALHARETDVSLPVLGNDELGELGRVFNQTLHSIKDMLFARSIQGKLIPQSVPSPMGYDLSLINVSCRDLGGDYCDAVFCGANRLLIAIGDVTGHGVSSALVTAMAKYGVVSYSRQEAPLTELMTRLNRILLRLLRKKKVMTFFATLLEPETGKMVFSNAGHPLPVIFRPDGTHERMEICRAPLGFSERAPFEEKEAILHPGDFVVFFTDGILEMRNSQGEAWGMPRFLATAERLGHESAEGIRDRLLQGIRDYVGPLEFDDDVTLIVLKRNP